MAVARDPTCPHPDKDGSDPVQSAQTPNAVLPLPLRENLIRRLFYVKYSMLSLTLFVFLFDGDKDNDVDETCQYEMPQEEEDHGGPHLASPRDPYSENCLWNFAIWQKEENTDYEYQLRLELKRNFRELSVNFLNLRDNLEEKGHKAWGSLVFVH